MSIEITKGVKDPLTLYNCIKEVILNPQKEFNNMLQNNLSSMNTNLITLNSFFREYANFLKLVEDYCKRYDYDWDVYPYYDTSDGLALNFLIKIEDFDIEHVSSGIKAWRYKEPYLCFSIIYGEEILKDVKRLSILSSKISVLAFEERFNHPHCRMTNIIVNIKQDKELLNYFCLIDNTLKYNNFCQGNSSIGIQYFNMDKSQEDFDFFMFRFKQYVKEYNISDVVQRVPTTIKEITIEESNKKEISFSKYEDKLLSSSQLKIFLKTLDIDLNYFLLDPEGYLDIIPKFWEEVSSKILNGNSSLSNIIEMLRENLMHKEKDISFSTIQDSNFIANSQEHVIESYEKKDTFMFNFCEKKISLSLEKDLATKKYIPEDFEFKPIFKNYFTNIISRTINNLDNE